MRMKPLALVLMLGPGFILSGCSSFSKALNLGDSLWSSDNYRSHEEDLAESLEVPPKLVKPKQNSNLDLLNGRESRLFEQGKLPSQVAQLNKQDIPAYKAKGITVKHTLCERWLALDDVNADSAWEGVQKFLKSLGYPVEEANRATGVIKTEYVARKEVVPMVDVSPLTKLFNKWRPEVAEGALDRFTVHVTVDGQTGQAQIRFHHHQVFQTDDGDVTVSRVKPYDPVKELEMLYQAAIFFGANQEAVLKQVQISAHTKEIVQGEELDGLALHAPMSEAWAYLQSMIWRADWQVEQVLPERHQMVVNLKENKADKGFFSSLAFWRHSSDLPDKVILTLKPLENAQQKTLLTLDVPEGAPPLTAEVKKKIFEKLGLLGE